VTLFGGIDARMNSLSATNAGTLNRLDNSGEYSSRLGFKGTEDLGGGWGAAFWLEAGIGNDDGRGQNTTSNNTNMGQNLGVGTGNFTPATAVTAGSNIAAGGTGTAQQTQYATPSTSGLNGLQGISFNRAATVSLMNRDLGELRAGRDYAPSFWNIAVYDPFGAVGVGSSANVALGMLNPAGASIAPPGTAKPEVRTSNSIGWLSPDWNGFRAQAQYAFSEVPSNCLGLVAVATGQSTSNTCVARAGDGKYTGFRLSYAQGPLSLAAATGTTKYATTVTPEGLASLNAGAWLNQGGNVPFLGDYKVTNFGGSYDLGTAKLWAQYGTQAQGSYTGVTFTSIAPAAGSYGAYTQNAATTPEGKLKNYLLGVTVPMGAWTHKFSYNKGTRSGDIANDRTQKQFAIGTVYAMSKRTSLYATASQMKADGVGATASQALTSSAATATDGVKATGFDLGVSHRF